jgi:hypothetical protein
LSNLLVCHLVAVAEFPVISAGRLPDPSRYNNLLGVAIVAVFEFNT